MAEARRFLLKADIVMRDREQLKEDSWWYASKHVAAVKRASMDLTRVLADLRQGR
jgi:hypothetical protein